jgi:hypothetical protein
MLAVGRSRPDPTDRMMTRKENKSGLMTNSVQSVGVVVNPGSVQNRLERFKNSIYLRRNHF